MLGIILSYSQKIDMEMLAMVTNGKNETDALALASMAREGILGVELSQDEYHEAIGDKVIKAFTFYGERRERDRRGIRTVNRITATGRGKNIAGASTGCVCEDLMVDPKGKIWACGCRRECFGTLDEPKIPQEYWEETLTCWTKRQTSKKELEAEEVLVGA
jgi:hypothetical protein